MVSSLRELPGWFTAGQAPKCSARGSGSDVLCSKVG